jgi:hypothetical protein
MYKLINRYCNRTLEIPTTREITISGIRYSEKLVIELIDLNKLHDKNYIKIETISTTCKPASVIVPAMSPSPTVNISVG